MINIFTPPSSDQSMYYLSLIFGNVGTLFPPNKEASMILGTMFKTFNTVVLAIGTLIIIYVTVVGVMKTASEGEFLGKQWNSIWMPIRMVIGIAALVPTASGYSSIQILIMWIIIQGIGAADTVWDKVLGYTDTFGSALASVPFPTVGVSNDLQILFQSLVCQDAARQTYTLATLGVGREAGSYYCSSPGSGSGSASASCSPSNFCACSQDSSELWNITGPLSKNINGQVIYLMGPNGHCGFLSFCLNPPECNDTTQMANQLKCSVCKAQASALQEVVNVLAPIAHQFVAADYEYRKFLKTKEIPQWLSNYCAANGGTSPDVCCITPSAPPLPGQKASKCIIPSSFTGGTDSDANKDVTKQMIAPYSIQPITGNIDFITASTNNYVTSITDAASTVIQQALENKTNYSNPDLTTARNIGWIFAGAFYYTLSKTSNSNLDAAMPAMGVVPVVPSTDRSNPLRDLRNDYKAASDLMDAIAQQTSGTTGADLSASPQLPDLGKLSAGLKGTGTSVMNIFYKMISGNKAGQLATNPLMSLQALGKALLIVAQTLFALIMSVTIITAILGYFSPFAGGFGFINPSGPTYTTLALIFAPLISLFLGSLFTFGAMLAVYTPLIPYIVFTMGAVSWFILVIEAMVAAPLVAIGILSPSGQHEVLGKAEHAVMYLFGIFLRPTLMIFGLIAAMLLAVVVVTMINAAFSGVMGQIYQRPGLVEILLFLGAYVGLVLAALNKCFALIYLVPDRVLRWIGGHPEETGGAAQEGLGGAKGGVEAAGKGAMAIGAESKARGEKMAPAFKGAGGTKKDQKEGERQPVMKADDDKGGTDLPGDE